MRTILGARAVLAQENAVVATGGSQAVGANAQVGQLVGSKAKVGNATIQFGSGNIMELNEIWYLSFLI